MFSWMKNCVRNCTDSECSTIFYTAVHNTLNSQGWMNFLFFPPFSTSISLLFLFMISTDFSTEIHGIFIFQFLLHLAKLYQIRNFHSLGMRRLKNDHNICMYVGVLTESEIKCYQLNDRVRDPKNFIFPKPYTQFNLCVCNYISFIPHSLSIYECERWLWLITMWLLCK